VVDAAAAVNEAASRTLHQRATVVSLSLVQLPNTDTTASARTVVENDHTLFTAVVRLGLELGRCTLSAGVTAIELVSAAGTRIPLLGPSAHVQHSVDLQFTVRATLGEPARGEWRVTITHSCAGGVVIAQNERSRIDFYAIAA
jgi:hypothetical protein